MVVPVILLMNYGIWLVPILPDTWHETHLSHSIRFSMLAGVVTWSGAIFSYYVYYAILLSLGVLPQMEYLNVFGDRYPGFWNDWMAVFQKVILNQLIEWILIAWIGGAIVGACVYALSRRNPLRRVQEG